MARPVTVTADADLGVFLSMKLVRAPIQNSNTRNGNKKKIEDVLPWKKMFGSEQQGQSGNARSATGRY
ncbi:hypothetical protein ABH975_002725 [Bradyrhizobium ottawaense]